jgi:hypothetical protein
MKAIRFNYTGLGNKKFSIGFDVLPACHISDIKYSYPVGESLRSIVINFGWLMFSWRTEIVLVPAPKKDFSGISNY